MVKSTASFIAYDVRPEKQIERRAIVEYLNLSREAGFNLGEYRYVGFGGTKFIDFQIMSRYVGLKSYVSIEHDPEVFKRCAFNKPFRSIDMYEGEVSEFLRADKYEGNTVYWLDLELKIGVEVLEILKSVAGRVKEGDILFVTICGEPPAGLNKKSDAERMPVLRSQIPSLKAAIERIPNKDMSSKRFPGTSGKLLIEMLRSAFSSRIADGKFHPHFKAIYKDSMFMCTVGGVFCGNFSRKPRQLFKLCELKMPRFVSKNEFYNIPKFNFTELERILIQKSSVSAEKGYIRRLKSIGLQVEELVEYEHIARFVPKYMESVL